VNLEIGSTRTPFTHLASEGQKLRLPIGHGEGCYVADEETLNRLEREERVVVRYGEHCNGSLRNIAGIVNEGRNVMGMMPHPERAASPVLGNTDGLLILNSLLNAPKLMTTQHLSEPQHQLISHS
jgi:phosphoribosylformylglycinamidine synthase